MKKLLWLLWFVPMFGFGQVRDDFLDGNFSDNPAWIGDSLQFEVSSAGQLHLFSSGTDTSILLTRNSQTSNIEWTFWMKMSFNTSANNYARVYLIADTMDLKTGRFVFLQVGGTDDSISVIRQEGSTLATLYRYRSFVTNHSTNTMRFKIIHDDIGQWEAWIDTTGGFNFYKDGNFYENSTTSARWFGVYCRYTSSNATKVWFDDFYVGPVIHDTVSPAIISQEGLDPNLIRVTFSEPVVKEKIEDETNFQVFSLGNPDSARLEPGNPCAVLLRFSGMLTEGKIDTLSVRGIDDISGNRMNDTLVPVFYYRAKAFDVVINEIFADPEPQVELPIAEYIELYNRTKYPFNLKGWEFNYGSYSRIFPDATITAGGYLIVSKDTVYKNYGNSYPLFTSSTSLSNEGTTLTIKDDQKQVVHSVTYSPDWYGGSFKEEGGWSLEMIDPDNPCGCGENWGASTGTEGGTPGRANGIKRANPDLIKPVVSHAYIGDSTTLEVFFSEAMDSLSLVNIQDWLIEPGEAGQPVKATPVSPQFSRVKLNTGTSFSKGIIYRLKTSDKLADCAGNSVDSSRMVRFAIPDSISASDVVINEILADPATGGARFVELYNRSEKILDLQSLMMATDDSTESAGSDADPLIDEGYLFFPGDYFVLTTDPSEVIQRYRTPFPQSIREMPEFPVLGNDSGMVVIARKDNLAVIDRVKYDAGMHYPLLASKEGVSLERASPDLPSGDRNNWHSAAETVGFATPGYMNSHRFQQVDDGLEISLTPEIFSPDNDGFDDLLYITIRETDPGYSANIFVYDSRGRLIRQIANQMFIGNEGIFSWDGITETNQKAAIGIYVLLFEITRPNGDVKKVKKTTVLGGRLSD